MKRTSALVLVFALAGLDSLAARTFSPEYSDFSQATSDGECRVPNLIGLDRAAADARLRQARLHLGAVQSSPSDAAPGTVIDQRPRACEYPPRDGGVAVLVSSGRAAREEPRSHGGSSVGTAVAIGAAAAILGAVIAAKRKPPAERPAEPEPRPGPREQPQPQPEPVRPRTPERSAVVPDVVAMPAASAAAAISNAQLRAMTQNPSDDPRAVVESQVPAAGTRTVPGATVAITLAVPALPVQAPQPPVTGPAPADTALRPADLAAPPVRSTPPPAAAPAPAAPAAPAAPIVPSRTLPIGFAPAPAIQPAPVEQPAPQREPVWPWIVLAIAMLAAAAAWVLRRTRRRTPGADVPPRLAPPTLTLVPRVDPGRQAITVGGRSRTLEFAVCLDAGVQVLLEEVSREPIGVAS